MSERNCWPRARPSPDQARVSLAAIVELADDAMIATDLTGLVTGWNNAARILFGYAADEIAGRSVTRIIRPDRLDEEAATFDRVRAGGPPVRYETERQHRNGTSIPVALTLAPIRDDLGYVIGVAKIARDLRPRREPPRREVLLRSVLNAVAEALIVTDGRGLVWLFSAAAERMFGYTAAEVIGQNVSMLMPASGRLPHAGHLALTDEWHAIGAPRLVTGQRKNGSMFAVELTVGEAAVHGERLFTGALRELTQPEDRRAASSRRPARKSVRRRVE